MVKYLKIMNHYKIDYNLSDFVVNKYYREEMMKNVYANNYKEKYVDFELENLGDVNEEEIEEIIEGQLDYEDEDDEEIVDDDNELNVTEEPEGEEQKNLSKY
jgi:hypothetical protein